MVGFDGYIEQLLDQLTGHHSGRQIFPIVGMGGIGKTTLATNVYQNSFIMGHFYVRAWITVSQEFSKREILLKALSCLEGSTSEKDRTDDQLGEKLHKILLGRRYLIVLDDMWSVEAWEKIKFFFPENNNRSRIVVTTRQQELVDYSGSSVVAVKFLDDNKSWELFCEKTFAQQGCPHTELEKVGKKIVKKCKGLPLAISVIGGLLGKSPKTQEYWEKIVEDKSKILDSGEGNIKPLSVLYLSYKHLPIWLKPCFLYLGLFPEDHKIDVPQLIKLWVAEGFIKSKIGQSLEEVAESYTKELVDRNLLLVNSSSSIRRKIETCCVHDVIRELCIRIAEKENLLYAQRDIDGKCHFIVDEPTARLFYPRESQETLPSLIRPLIVEGQRAAPLKCRLLRVLFSVYGGRLYSTHGEVGIAWLRVDQGHLDSTFREVNLRFLSQARPANRYHSISTYNLPSSISLIWSLQTIIVTASFPVVAPSEIWKMPQLRHIQVFPIFLPPPPPSGEEQDNAFVLQNLQTLRQVKNLILTEEVCKRIPNINELEIYYKLDIEQGGASPCYLLQNLGCFNKLLKLRYFCNRWDHPGDDSLQNLKLPSSLKELTLQDCKLVWSDMAMIASLPHLQILKLEDEPFVGSEWDFGEEQFFCLKYLRINGCRDLVYWNTESSNFPVLETLDLGSLSNLKEIPLGMGEISTLERINVFNCSESASISAVKILDEQESLGNEGLHIYLHIYDQNRAKMLREKIQELVLTCQNLHIPDTF